ncbi:MAG: GTP cyclohydrolase MptA [Candidatus Bathyarchaeia archaeon]
MELPDVQSEGTTIPISIGKVGVTGVKAPIGSVSFGGKPIIVLPTFDVFVDLPANQKGIHASRNYEIIAEILNKHVGKTYRLENICGIIASELLQSHRYTSRSEVIARGELILEKAAPKTGRTSYESCKLSASAIATRNSRGRIETRKTLGVGVTGLTACPCGHEMMKGFTQEELTHNAHLPKETIKTILQEVPIATHMQRSFGSITTEIPDGFEIEISNLANVVEHSMSASTYGLLKRSDEAELIHRAIGKPRFAEDCIRHMMRNFAKSFPALPNSVSVNCRLRSEESIHKHDLFAERTITLGAIKKGLKSRA